MRMRIDKIDVWSTTKISAFIGLITGILIGLIYFVIISITIDVYFGLTMLVFSPLAYSIISGISGAIYAWLYNVGASSMGGIKLNYSEKK